MNSGIYSPAFRMIVGQVNKLEAITENLANSTAPGYRRIDVDHKKFDLIFRRAVDGPMNWQSGEQFDPISVDFTPGPLKTTERSLDFAMAGDGFFVVQQDGKDYYTRDGSFGLDPGNRLVNSGQMPVKGKNGEIVLPPNTTLSALTVNSDGSIYSGNRMLDTLETANFPDLAKLKRVGPALFAPPADMKPEPLPADSRVINRTLEMSNTTVFAEMADMISCFRSYEACQRMIRSQDESQGRLLQQMNM